MPSSASLRVATRGSTLALAQTRLAVEALGEAGRRHGIEVDAEIVTVRTKGDRITDRPFETIGPKGIFVREVQSTLIGGDVDIAVHSLKDLPAVEEPELAFAAVLERSDPRDVLVSRTGAKLADLEAGAVVGTSSTRRRALVAIARPDLHTAELRGNVETRLDKVARGEVDAAVLAGAGLARLDRVDAVTEWLSPLDFVPPPGQGAIVIEMLGERLRDDLAWTADAEHATTRRAVDAERSFMRVMEGGCQAPLGAWAEVDGTDVVLHAFISDPDGSAHFRDVERSPDGVELGRVLAERMLEAGARNLRPS